MVSPYIGLDVTDWEETTNILVNEHPLNTNEIVEVVLDAWNKILTTKIGEVLLIGDDVFPGPQIMGNYLHELIPVIFSLKYPNLWKKELIKEDKDMVYIPNKDYSVEIKTSSNPTNIFGNRSFGQDNSDKNSGKSKSGYYLTINFEKFDTKNKSYKPKIKLIRFGWIDHWDWRAQKAATGQQASLDPSVRDKKLILLYSN